jgi:hypothetical protein
MSNEQEGFDFHFGCLLKEWPPQLPEKRFVIGSYTPNLKVIEIRPEEISPATDTSKPPQTHVITPLSDIPLQNHPGRLKKPLTHADKRIINNYLNLSEEYGKAPSQLLTALESDTSQSAVSLCMRKPEVRKILKLKPLETRIPKTDLTPREKQVKEADDTLTQENGYPPTQAQIIKRTGITQQNVSQYIRNIRAKGVEILISKPIRSNTNHTIKQKKL